MNINPNELVWDELNQKVRDKQPTRVAHLWQLLQENGAGLYSVYLQSLVPRTCDTVRAAKEGYFDE